jgi:hypothetical protein
MGVLDNRNAWQVASRMLSLSGGRLRSSSCLRVREPASVLVLSDVKVGLLGPLFAFGARLFVTAHSCLWKGICGASGGRALPFGAVVRPDVLSFYMTPIIN